MCYLAIEKPIVLLLPNNITSGQLQEALNVSLYVGAYPSVINNVLLPQEHALLLSNYRPLFELLRERKWLLMPHAITVDEPACMANCFVLKDGRYAISLISQPDTAIELKSADGYIISQTINKNASSEKIPLHLALPELANFSKWTLYQSNAHEHTAKTFTLHNTEIIRVDIDDPKNGVLITFE
jgi:hypothetical protein